MGSNTFAERAGSEVLPGAKHVANGKCQTYAGSALDPGGVSPTIDNSGLDTRLCMRQGPNNQETCLLQ